MWFKIICLILIINTLAYSSPSETEGCYNFFYGLGRLPYILFDGKMMKEEEMIDKLKQLKKEKLTYLYAFEVCEWTWSKPEFITRLRKFCNQNGIGYSHIIILSDGAGEQFLGRGGGFSYGSKKYPIVILNSIDPNICILNGKKIQTNMLIKELKKINHGKDVSDLSIFNGEDNRAFSTNQKLIKSISRFCKEEGVSSMYVVMHSDRIDEIKALSAYFQNVEVFKSPFDTHFVSDGVVSTNQFKKGFSVGWQIAYLGCFDHVSAPELTDEKLADWFKGYFLGEDQSCLKYNLKVFPFLLEPDNKKEKLMKIFLKKSNFLAGINGDNHKQYLKTIKVLYERGYKLGFYFGASNHSKGFDISFRFLSPIYNNSFQQGLKDGIKSGKLSTKKMSVPAKVR